MHPVISLLQSRRAAGGRVDGHRLALAVEGGGSRGAFSGGMVVALAELGYAACFDAVFGSSAGALNGAWFLAGQARPDVMAWDDPAVIRRVTNPWRALRLGPVVDTTHLVQVVYETIPMDFAAILANPTTFHPLATDTATGAATDLHPLVTDQRTLQLALRASTGLPLLSGPPVRLGGRTFIDAGLAEAIPFRTPLARGFTDVLVLRTRQTGWTAGPPSRLEGRVVSRYLDRVAPGALSSWEGRAARQEADDRDLATDPAVLEVRPAAGAPEVGRLTRDTALLTRAVAAGREAVLRVLSP
ncbi:patatin-like phospholipase family protein [Actinokineospora spheciospongiae]|uniref:patatin-like phospholipase family protein n=1 Tax=Actinokineospora spheciospongiae TaxID=909613 RepID=UPI000D71DA6E|nr:patatin-like phospholipase family protein [Actinokineospora spheciospongiae]PWW64370.1 patatin-like phospholipase [Actinokineospora spheciospongiae]